jgi:hypothetical protein
VLDTIKSYLVSLGFSVDKSSYNEATKAIDGAGHNVTKFASGAVKNFAIAGVAVTSFAAAAVVGIAKFLDGLGEASIKNEMLARQMWTSEQNAMSYNATLKAMGVSLQDLYLSPTLMSQFKELRQEANNLQAPSDYKEKMKLIQSVSFEFKRMKLEAGYALQWIGYYFIKYMNGPITSIKKELTSINNVIVKEMPSWTKEVAKVMSWFAQFGITTVRAIKDVIRIFDDIGSGIPKNIKLIGAAIVGLGAIISTGPIGILIAIFTGLILLLDDFYTYLDGGESQFGPFWKKLVEMFDKFKGIGDIVDGIKQKFGEFFKALEDNGTIDNFKQNFENNFKIIGLLFDGAKKWVKELFDELGKSGVLKDLLKSFEDVLAQVSGLQLAVSNLILQLLGLDGTKKTLGDIGKILIDTIIYSLKTASDILTGIANTIELIKQLVSGNIFNFLSDNGESADARLQEKAKKEPKKSYWGNVLQAGKEFFSDSWTGEDNTLDRFKSAMGRITNLITGTPGVATSTFQYPQTNAQNNNNSKTTLSPTYNLYGYDVAGAYEASQQNTSTLIRSFNGVQR